ncbi:ECF transporter S component [Brochothrix campestris]|uniref:Membrane protein n=1 Tax=Brochothrix campestris FSL F6-1037 TaxID=1265861 RepID=W7CPM0_9LIST|nr:ECF transporter S component [Brochothrix campestris]EUJ41594.1 membrane protein [Brochothrix campestris FSL F6-1037]
MKTQQLTLKDILVAIVIALVFGLLYKVGNVPYDLLKPFGLQLEQVIYGFWFMAGPFAMLVIRKPGVALIAEAAAALIETFFAGGLGMQSFVYGIGQGIACELIFIATRYNRFTMDTTIIAGLLACLASFLIDWPYGYLAVQPWALLLIFIFRVVGTILIAGCLSFYLAKTMEKTGVAQLVRPITKDDYDALD